MVKIIADKDGYIPAASTRVVCSQPGVLIGLLVSCGAAGGSVTLYDYHSTAGAVLMKITLPASVAQPFTWWAPEKYALRFDNGLTVVTDAGVTANIIAEGL